ncbi:MAG: prepilin-type N-terminal cleavage/methylation domain-containing protein [Pirellula sp.]|jgi:prepilin-type N-terminal cleavage/methylation domain-containing protein|nr:prepilin-type N-terminal cleavage/methylation domain-containing protein [Pirellula sp.]
MLNYLFPSKGSRCGFTLIELLVTISIMATVAGMFLVAYRSAATEASNVRTSSTIRKINEVLIARIQEYEAFRLEPQAIDPAVAPSAATGFRFRTTQMPGNAQAIVLPPVGMNPNPNQEGTTTLLERARLFGLRQTMVQEMPDHPDDLKWTTTWYGGGNVEQHLQFWLCNSHAVPTGVFAPGRPQIFAVTDLSARTRQLIRRLSLVDPMTGGISPIPGWETTNANAELLYLIIEDSNYNGSSALELFGRSEIRDTDGDGLYEFVDAFGNPIRWIRWPSGSDISVRAHPDLMDPALVGSDVQGDPMDRSKADPGYAPYSTFRQLIGLRPLVISPGPDRRFGVRMQLDTPISIGPPLFPANQQSFSLGDVPLGVAPQPDLPYSSDPIDAYVGDPWYPRDNETLRLGAPRTNTSRPAFNPSFPLASDFYDVAQDAIDNISNLETGGGALQ